MEACWICFAAIGRAEGMSGQRCFWAWSRRADPIVTNPPIDPVAAEAFRWQHGVKW